MAIATAITVTLVFLALLWFYRSILAVLALLFVLGTGALATFGFAQLTIGHLNLAGMPWPPSSFVPIPPPLAKALCYFPKIAASVPLDSQVWSVKSRVWSSPLW
jgi:hypothetical protein